MRHRRLLFQVVAFTLVLLGVGDVLLSRWRGAIFFCILGLILLLLPGGLDERVLPRRVAGFVRPHSARGAAVLAIAFGYFAAAIGVLLIFLNDAVEGGVIVAFSSLILVPGFRVLAQTRKVDAELSTGDLDRDSENGETG